MIPGLQFEKYGYGLTKPTGPSIQRNRRLLLQAIRYEMINLNDLVRTMRDRIIMI